ncbi:TrkA family potassium uptake protein [Demequina sp.]|uniref:potassium channel family protein n=1 Tax=Demequina sp. TaxID=2050685 RepID=UPI0025BA1695|nr:TrkA family potassium uptake protein [Demequina sp.]
MGCGRTGATLASEFESRGHSVAVIDARADAFRRLPSHFKGQKITGLGFDRDTLSAAGAEEAYAFAAVSDGDNSNILAARVVRETYGVENVVARIADSGRAEVYRRLGIPTVAPVPWTAAQIVTRLLPGGSDALYADVDAGIAMRRLPFNDGWVGHACKELEHASGARIAYLTRFGAAVLPDDQTVLQDGDDVYAIVAAATERAAIKAFGHPPQGTS